ncbi:MULTISPECIES: hypothetical protein [unclassified Citrobacter]|uniref:hypothetical protein n=1 Tax=unclassified Citrobacter TaxID=2644389 RepID=UPI001B3638AF|nr:MULTISPECIES: hypothetical protein [unclassified Citrobacter]MBP8542002.1 hypothetical protein [Citrobacter sp. On2M]MBP8543490.1 hypothetical protein [Citrobacter sp. On2M]MBW5274235.1 hypothetical protein [Citrobacter sp. On28M]
MSTTTITVSDDWQQVTTGTETKLLQICSGVILVADSLTKPDVNSPGYVIRGFVQITPPTIAWIRNSNSGEVLVTI